MTMATKSGDVNAVMANRSTPTSVSHSMTFREISKTLPGR